MASRTDIPEYVKCEVCLTEVPGGDAHHTETKDYVLYFCGLDCYQQWQKQQTTETPDSKESTD